MTTTTTATTSSTEAGESAVRQASPTRLLLPSSNGHRTMPPLRVRTPTADEDRRTPTLTAEQHRPPLIMDVAIRCTSLSCSCDCFSPCKVQIRTCDGCGHGWVSHALDKLGFRHIFNCHQVELVQPSIAFDVASLMLYGTQAIPVRLKILLDRLFSVLRHDEVLHVLHGFGWTHEDYTRGYILQDPSGRVLDRWLLATREEEPLILQQFLRFGETKTIAHQLLLQETSERPDFVAQSPRTESDIKKFIERANKSTAVKSGNNQSVPVALPLVNRHFHRQPSSSLSSTHSLSPTAESTPNCNNSGSPASLSPLNRLQNMQPYDYRLDKESPDARTSDVVQFNNSVSHSSPSSSPATSTLAVSTSSALSTNALTTSSKFHTLSSDFSGEDGEVFDDDDDSSNAINLTRTNSSANSSYLDSIFAAKKVRHLRKSANPMKRRWNTMVLSTLATNPSTGKKRVQCHVCLKTFCDKGALKIHFSAVHLREMHKCTVEGCNMMFSSRRSRNRHSANPNPKLHTPNYRRKINPHDGRSANPYPLIPATGISFNNSLLGGNATNHFDGDSNTPSEIDPGHPNDTLDYSHPHNDLRQHSKSRKLALLLPEQNDSNAPLPLTKKRKMDDDRIRDEEDRMTNHESSKGMDLTLKEDRNSSSKVVHKRKSLNPIKCQVNSDDDLQYVSTDDSSSDTYIEQEMDENGQLDSKSDCLSSIDSKDDYEEDDTRTERKFKTSSSVVSSCSSTSQNCSPPPLVSNNTPNPPAICTSSLISKFPIEKQNGFVSAEMDSLKKEILRNQMASGDDISENPLRHLESLSLGSFANMMNSNRTQLSQNTHVSSGVSYHAPCLGLGSSAITTMATSRVETPPRPPSAQIQSHHHNHSGSLVSPPASQQLTSGQLNSDPENSLPDQQMSLLPVYRDASIVGSVEIPVDKENPRRCTACGKIFQNHFGVKTHYQNVHLKLMHKCTVEGCNAAFPSKRSRDRHSANLNLHRKLLSTTSEKSPSYFDKGGLYPYHAEAALRGDFFSRLYDTQTLPLGFAELYHSRLSGDAGFLGGSQYPRPILSGFHPAFMLPPTTTPSLQHPIRPSMNDGRGSGRDSPVSSVSSTNLSPQSQCSPRREPSVNLEEDLKPDSEGRFACNICEKKFHENVVLREHYENCHSNVLLRCTDDGCNKVFLSGKTRTIHTNELHKERAIEAS